jgi:hypothetical protein
MILASIGQTNYTKFHSLGNIMASEVTPSSIRLLNPKGEQELKPETPITAEVVGYDEDKDEFIFIATKNFVNVYGKGGEYDSPSGSGYRFAVKRKDLPTEVYGNFEIIKDGKKVKIGTLTTSTTATPTETDAQILMRKAKANAGKK